MQTSMLGRYNGINRQNLSYTPMSPIETYYYLINLLKYDKHINVKYNTYAHYILQNSRLDEGTKAQQ